MQLKHEKRLSYTGAVVILTSMAFCILNGYSTQAFGGSKVNNTTNFFFICEPYDDLKITCYPSKIHVDGRLTTGSSTKIYEVSSRSADYSNSRNRTALSLPAFLGEYIIVNGSDKFNFANFTISFWI